MKDLKHILIQIKHHNNLKTLTDTEEYKESLIDISININNLSEQITGAKPNVNKSRIISDLESIESQLSEFEGLLKFGNND
jgi:hypothetical protein